MQGEEKQIVKLVITGPVNAGKTTMVQNLSDSQVAATDVSATDSVAELKAMTTVGLDFGILKVDDMLELHLFGTPGQSRFNFMWNILSRGAIGAIFLVDSTSDESMAEMKKMFDYYAEHVDLPVIVGATKQDLPGARSVDEIASLLGLGDVMVIPVDAREKEGSKMLALTLLGNALVEAGADDDFDDETEYDDLF
ncbi:mutual gliding-motility protein MglA [Mariprofundus micogutta]|uniref:Mutual gliding-motility protein MglA n=1 Tax=Mariprofundus micogutta TaxID=1921010 RepID=A0A1L8CLQ8_9PROT|nr:ATP/GTP-binding protein [Mariprofundus micogutta]GAV19857.1 mutual gliding-motility protein MglA [Mariprofundus micogutta]